MVDRFTSTTVAYVAQNVLFVLLQQLQNALPIFQTNNSNVIVVTSDDNDDDDDDDSIL